VNAAEHGAAGSRHRGRLLRGLGNHPPGRRTGRRNLPGAQWALAETYGRVAVSVVEERCLPARASIVSR
jgi:hypothetical protein